MANPEAAFNLDRSARKENSPRAIYGAAENLRRGGEPVILQINPDEQIAKVTEMANQVLLSPESESPILAEPLGETGSKKLKSYEMLLVVGESQNRRGRRLTFAIRNVADTKAFVRMSTVAITDWEKVKGLIASEDLLAKE